MLCYLRLPVAVNETGRLGKGDDFLRRDLELAAWGSRELLFDRVP
ncbi:MAG: hypothetical protein ACRYGI_20355 [Janthinobacterium lividum]